MLLDVQSCEDQLTRLVINKVQRKDSYLHSQMRKLKLRRAALYHFTQTSWQCQNLSTSLKPMFFFFQHFFCPPSPSDVDVQRLYQETLHFNQSLLLDALEILQNILVEGSLFLVIILFLIPCFGACTRWQKHTEPHIFFKNLTPQI